ncbi:tetratricopeptide repeat-containing sensor histidine kinase [Aquimarina sp. 2304DJ70-9]|uniref:tetratricopeptide repeat-containing sensor histidine kinase n=1 Tax=Aquimarina penaris TaxID=3231044 RepID=UPI003462A4FF
MFKLIQHAFLYILLIIPLAISAQVNDNNIPYASNEVIIFNEEEEQIDKAYTLLNANDKRVYTIAHEFLKTLKSKRSLINTNLILAHYFKNKALIDSSIFYVNRSLKYTIVNDSVQARLHTSAYNILAVNYINKGLFEESKKWRLKGIETAEKFNEKYYYYLHTHGLARVYFEIDDLKKALELFKKCLQYKKEKEIIYGSYINIGAIYTKMQDFESSDEYYKRGLKLAEKDNAIRALASIKFNLASNAQYQGKLDEAISLYNETIKIAEEYELHQIKLMAQMDIGSVLIDQKKYQEAQGIYINALENAIELGYLNQQLFVYENLKQIAINQSDYKSAFHYVSQYFKVKDSIGKLQKDKEINELEVKFNTLQKEKEIKFLQIENRNRTLELANQEKAFRNLKFEQEIEKKEGEIRKKESENKILSFKNTTEKTQTENILLKKDRELKQAELKINEAKLTREKSIKNTILYSFLIILIPIIGLLIIYYQKLQTQSELNKKQEEINQEKISSLMKDQELKVIKASVEGQDKERKRIAQELHDSIGGNLAAIKLQLNNTITNKKQDGLKAINNQIDDTYEQVRSLSHNLIPKKFIKNNFCDVLEEHINNIGGVSNLNTSFVGYPRKKIDLLEENMLVETFKIIQELITNTIKHSKATSIELQLNLVENVLSILFEDNGIGFEMKENTDGIGFRNIKSRLKKISGTLHIDSRIKRGTIINIEIPNLTTIHEI